MNVSRELLKLGEAGSGVELAVRGLSIMGDDEVEVDEKNRGMLSGHTPNCFFSNLACLGSRSDALIF